MKNHVFIAISLDGYIADAQGSVEWLNNLTFENTNNSQAVEDAFTNFMQCIDAVIMGRKTFETIKSFDTWIYNKPVIVMSTTLRHLENKFADKVRICHECIDVLLTRLESEGFRNLYVDGGKLIQSFLQKDLIDSMTITKVPVLLGSGIPLFGSLPQMLTFEHEKTKILPGGFVVDTYVRKK